MRDACVAGATWDACWARGLRLCQQWQVKRAAVVDGDDVKSEEDPFSMEKFLQVNVMAWRHI